MSSGGYYPKLGAQVQALSLMLTAKVWDPTDRLLKIA